ncbi:MAG TPA: endonuclease/exonuclease/phosphatase family protein [Pyrinomonadaceae bacterium]|nr:endonuclease/exonuclease/phosphatase family protein [Pyrinomonadaceae bacterium]
MWWKTVVGLLFVSMLVGAFFLRPARDRSGLDGSGKQHEADRRLRLMTWNIGHGNLESDTRAHSEDFPAVAELILRHDPDAVAIQELTGPDQLNRLLGLLQDRYHGFAGSNGSSDRVTAVLVRVRPGKNFLPQFASVPAGDKFAAAATFLWTRELPEIVFISAHADASKASRRRTFVSDLIDWKRQKTSGKTMLIAADLNFEVSTQKQAGLFTDSAKHDSESYTSLLKHFSDLGRDAGATAVNARRIDYVFGPLGALATRAEVLRGAAIGRMDHWPLLVEITF